MPKSISFSLCLSLLLSLFVVASHHPCTRSFMYLLMYLFYWLSHDDRSSRVALEKVRIYREVNIQKEFYVPAARGSPALTPECVLGWVGCVWMFELWDRKLVSVLVLSSIKPLHTRTLIKPYLVSFLLFRVFVSARFSLVPLIQPSACGPWPMHSRRHLGLWCAFSVPSPPLTLHLLPEHAFAVIAFWFRFC